MHRNELIEQQIIDLGSHHDVVGLLRSYELMLAESVRCSARFRFSIRDLTTDDGYTRRAIIEVQDREARLTS